MQAEAERRASVVAGNAVRVAGLLLDHRHLLFHELADFLVQFGEHVTEIVAGGEVKGVHLAAQGDYVRDHQLVQVSAFLDELAQHEFRYRVDVHRLIDHLGPHFGAGAGDAHDQVARQIHAFGQRQTVVAGDRGDGFRQHFTHRVAGVIHPQ